MIADLTPKQKTKLLDPRLNQAHLEAFIFKWIHVPNEQRPSYITDMLKRFSDMTAKEQATFYVNPLTDELTIIDPQQTRKTYTKSYMNGWKQTKYHNSDK